MSLKPKTSKRLLILAGILVAVSGGVATLVVVRQHQRQSAITNARAEGMRLFQEKNYYTAMGALSKYLASNEKDREATLAYAKCREMIEEPKGENILQAISHYQRALAMDRTDRETSLHLLELMPLAGLNVETRELAVKLRPESLEACTVEHVAVMRAEANARIASNPADPMGEALLRRLLELTPDDLPARVVLVEHLRERKRVPDALQVASGVSNVSSAEGAAKRRLLTAIARRDEPAFDSNGEVFAALCDITGLDPNTAGPTRSVQFTSALEVLRTSALFDGLGSYAHGLAVLLEGKRQFDDPVVARLVARRTWTAGRAADTVSHTSPADLTPAGTHSEILVYRALALIDQGKRDEARAIADALAQRRGDFRAAAWSKALPIRTTEPRLAPDRALSILAEALQAADDDPVLLVWQGDELERLGKIDEARKSWERASRSSISVGWMVPALRRAYLALAQNQPNAALRASQEAFRISPRSMGAFSALFRSHIAVLEAGTSDGSDPGQLLSTANRIDEELSLATNAPDAGTFRSMMLPGRVILTSRTAGREAGRALLTQSLDQPITKDADTLAALVEVSRTYKLGAEDVLLRKLEERETNTPRVVLLAALVKHDAGDASGLDALTQGAANAKEADKQAWGRARASYLDRIQSPLAGQAWMELADQYAGDVAVQLAALQSPGVSQKPDAVAKLLERVAKLSNFSLDTAPPQLRLVRARSLLAEPLTASNRRAAVEILRSLVVQEPDMFEARVTLVLALLMDRAELGISPQRGDAIQQVRAIVPLAPDAEPWSLELGKLYRLEGDAQAARGEFERLANAAKNSDVRLAAAELLLDLRSFESASAAMERAAQELTGTPRALAQILRARALHGLSRDGEATTLLASVDAASLTSGTHVLQLADAMASAGQTEKGRQVLAKIDAVEPARVQQLLLRARFESRYGSDKETEALLREAATLTPASSEAFMALAAFLVEHDKSEDARAVLRQAIAALPGDARLASMAKQLESMAQQPMDTLDLAALASVLEQSTQTTARAQLVRTIEQARVNNQLRTPAQAAVLRDAVREDPVVLALLARVLMRTDPPNVAGASDVAATGVRLFPSSVETLSASIDVSRAQGDWSTMLASAQALQQVSKDPGASASMGEALLNLRRFDEALQALQPLLQDALAQPDTPAHARVLGLFGGAHVLAGRPQAAFDVLLPVLGASANLRNDFWLPTAGSTIASERDVMAWINAGVKAATPTSERDQIAIAQAYAGAARRFSASSGSLLASAKATLEPLARAENASSALLESLASVLVQAGDASGASGVLERSLKKGESADALRMAARIALASDPDKGVALAERSVKARNDAASQQTLGLAQLARAHKRATSGDQRGAQEAGQQAVVAFGAVLERLPANFDARLGMIDALELQGKVGEALVHHDALLNLPDLPAGVSRAALQNNAAYAILRAGRTGMELERARGLVESAIRAQPLAPFYDTLGAIEVARKDRSAAIAAYRKAVALDASMGSSWAALAEQLAQGTEEERQAAGDAARKALALPGLDPVQKARVEQLLPKK